MKLPSRRDAGYGKRISVWLARRLLLLAVMLSTSAVLLAALGVRLRSVEKLTGSACSPACTAGAHRDPLNPRVAAGQGLATQTTGLELSGDEDADESRSDDSPVDHDDGGDIDEMIAQRQTQICRASFFTLLWHETPRLSGVIHSPEPRPARRV
jgi:hypothetical protein